jgi:NADH:ubiquinone oxidoreductase subunit 6 (subunit J)
MPTSHLAEFWPVILPLLAGAAAVFFLLPRPRGRSLLAGSGLAALALLLTGSLVVRVGAFTPETFLFLVFSAIAVLSGGLLVTQRNPARAALSFALVVLSTSGLFLLQAAPFLMAATIIIYAGAIIVTFLFVIMLAQQAGLSDADARSREPLLSTITGFVLLGALLYVLHLSYGDNFATRTLKGQLARIQEAKGRLQPDDLVDRFPGSVKEALNKASDETLRLAEEAARDHQTATAQELRQQGRELHQVAVQLDEVQLDWPDNLLSASDDDKRQALARLEAPLLRSLQRRGFLEPAGNVTELSEFSGPRPNLPARETRQDAEGRPPMPAENSAYLGRSLFTDFLLPVELGGTLLLVATVGAIAIAHRRVTPGRAP